MEWVAQFQEEVETLDKALTTLVRDYTLTEKYAESDRYDLNQITETIHLVKQWSDRLPMNDETASLVHWPEAFSGTVFFLERIAGAILHLLFKCNLALETPDAMMSCLEGLRSMIDQMRETLQTLPVFMPDIPMPDRHFLSLDLSSLVSVVHITTHRYVELSFDAPPETMRVIYHPYYTLRFLYDVVECLSGASQDRVTLAVKTTPKGFELALTVKGLFMTPDVWQRVLTWTPNHIINLEVLREMGGEIDPLTWDEGQGEGVVVRLPWAKTS